MNKNYTPSPWGPEPVTALMAIPKMTEFRNKIWEAQLDESKATTDYIDLSNMAHELGLTDVAHTLQAISEDEHKHFVAITTILNKLEE
jgi:rubrerythrin